MMMRPRPSPPSSSSSFTAAKRRPVLVQRLPRAFDSIERVLRLRLRRLRLFPPRKKSTPRFARGRRRRRRRRGTSRDDDSFARRTLHVGASFPGTNIIERL